MTWLSRTTSGATPLERALGLSPALLEGYRRLAGRLWEERLVDPGLLELCRLRIAQLHRSQGEQLLRYEAAVDAGITEEVVADLPEYWRSDRFTAHQRACIAYAEAFVMDAHAVSDEQFSAMAAGFRTDEVVAFGLALALFDGVGRVRTALELDAPFDRVTVVPTPSTVGPVY